MSHGHPKAIYNLIPSFVIGYSDQQHKFHPPLLQVKPFTHLFCVRVRNVFDHVRPNPPISRTLVQNAAFGSGVRRSEPRSEPDVAIPKSHTRWTTR
jgi:hypothetical protein